MQVYRVLVAHFPQLHLYTRMCNCDVEGLREELNRFITLAVRWDLTCLPPFHSWQPQMPMAIKPLL
jgi:hypothetical protein